MAIYNLPGDGRFTQVEPSASYWSRCPILRTVSIDDVLTKLGDLGQHAYPANSQAELDLLEQLNAHRKDEAFFLAHPANPPSKYLTDPRYFEEPPTGAVVRKPNPAQLRGIATGLELATLFEAETPGLWHKHVLNMLLDPRKRLFGGPSARSRRICRPRFKRSHGRHSRRLFPVL